MQLNLSPKTTCPDRSYFHANRAVFQAKIYCSLHMYNSHMNIYHILEFVGQAIACQHKFSCLPRTTTCPVVSGTSAWCGEILTPISRNLNLKFGLELKRQSPWQPLVCTF